MYSTHESQDCAPISATPPYQISSNINFCQTSSGPTKTKTMLHQCSISCNTVFFYIGHSINAKEDLNKINFNLTLHKTFSYKVCERFLLPQHLQTFTWKRSRLKSEIWSPGSTHWKMAKTRGSAGNFKRDSAAHKILLLSRLIFHDPNFSNFRANFPSHFWVIEFWNYTFAIVVIGKVWLSQGINISN